VSRPPRRVSTALLALAAIWTLCLSTGSAGAATKFTASVSNPTNTAGSAQFFTCAAAAVANGAYLAWPLADSSTTAADISGNGRTGTYQGAVTHNSTGSCKRDVAGSLTWSGSQSYVSSAVKQTTPPATFSVEIWFKTTTAGGRLIGYSGSQTGQSGSEDRHIYLANTGQLDFGIYTPTNGTTVIQSAASYTDGLWHDVVATLSPTSGMALYVDGALVGTNAQTAAENQPGYWRVGWDKLAAWPNAPTNYFFTGSLGFAAVYTSVLTAAQVQAHHIAGV
jgi:hypothetical protein